MRMQHSSLLGIGLALGLVAACGQANAASITYTFNGNLSGSLNGSAFINDPFTLTLIGDTTGVHFFFLDNVLVSSSAIAQITLNGVSGTSTNPVEAFVFPSPVVGFLDLVTDTGFDMIAPSLGTTYDLTTSAGPATGTFYAAGTGFPTSLGSFDFTDFTGTFTASTSVPEPGVYALCASLSLTGVAFLRRRRTR